MHMTFGLLSVTLKNTYRRGNTIIYQRAVPAKLAGRYSGKTVKHDLKTSDLTIAEKAVALLNRRYEAEWAGLLAAPESSPASLKAHADAFLKDRGLNPGAPTGYAHAENHPLSVRLLHDEVDGKRMQFAGGDEWLYRNAEPSDYLTPVEREAGRRLHGTTAKTLNDALELHLEIHPQRDNAKFAQYQRRAFSSLIAVTGDREIDTFKKADARTYLEAVLLKVRTTIRLLSASPNVLNLMPSGLARPQLCTSQSRSRVRDYLHNCQWATIKGGRGGILRRVFDRGPLRDFPQIIQLRRTHQWFRTRVLSGPYQFCMTKTPP